jgi:competence protein ComEA
MEWRAYFTFSKRERIGILTMVFILLGLALLPGIWKKPPPVIQGISPAQFGDQLRERQRTGNYDPYTGNDSSAFAGRGYYQYDRPYRKNYDDRFTENNHWKNDRAKRYDVNRIQHGDWKKFDHGNYSYGNNYHSPQNANRFANRYNDRRTPPAIIDVNRADTNAFISLPCIGSRLASRIVLFREKLGGFYSVSQVREVYGVQDSTFRIIAAYLTCESPDLKKLNINLADRDQLKQHPYIRWNIANSVIAYRTAHGPFTSVHDLEKVNNIDSITLLKMLPYLIF